MPTETENNLPGVKTQNPNNRGKRSSFLNKTLFKTFAPALSAFAQVQKPGPDICEDDDMEEDEELKDLDVVAMVTDF